ncbi:MAG: methyltransferase domain-containing protein [Propionibacteriaceae bacterium]
MALDSICDVLACPHCGGPLTLHERMLQCENRHSFDIAKQGYLNLLGAAQPKNADTAAMVEARAAFLDQGWYSPIAQAVRHVVSQARTIADVGCGTGYYAAQFLDEGQRAVGLDISVPALRRAAKAHPQLGVVIADTWKTLPLRTASVDAITCIFAPRHLAEFARVLTPDGLLVIVTPDAQHLAEARRAFGLLDVEPGKHERLLAETAHQFELVSDDLLRQSLELDHEAARQVVAMGPNAFHNHAPTQQLPPR